jgi:hypothetical protein
VEDIIYKVGRLQLSLATGYSRVLEQNNVVKGRKLLCIGYWVHHCRFLSPLATETFFSSHLPVTFQSPSSHLPVTFQSPASHLPVACIFTDTNEDQSSAGRVRNTIFTVIFQSNTHTCAGWVPGRIVDGRRVLGSTSTCRLQSVDFSND